MIILLDVDGTLVDYTTALPASAERAVRAAVAAGHQVYLCTGRSRAEVYPNLWALGLHGMIGGNGSYVESEGGVIHHQVMASADVDHAVSWLTERELGFYVECNAGLYGSPDLIEQAAGLLPGGATAGNVARTAEALPHLIVTDFSHPDPQAVWRHDANKISFVLHDGLDLDALAAAVSPHVAIDTWSLTGARPEFGEFGQVGVHKGAAVARLAEHLGVGRDELVGFGDARSDIELLTACGTGVAMGQSPVELKAVATHVTGPVDADGLAHAFHRLGLV